MNRTSETVLQVKQENAKLLVQNKKLLDQLEKTSHQLLSTSGTPKAGKSSLQGGKYRSRDALPERDG